MVFDVEVDDGGNFICEEMFCPLAFYGYCLKNEVLGICLRTGGVVGFGEI